MRNNTALQLPTCDGQLVVQQVPRLDFPRSNPLLENFFFLFVQACLSVTHSFLPLLSIFRSVIALLTFLKSNSLCLLLIYYYG